MSHQLKMKNFAIIGAAGYIAPRHMRAIKETGNVLLAAMDPHDSVGVLDHYFPAADFFTEFERFDRHLEKLKKLGTPIDYLSVCTPNYMHDAHIRFGLRSGADVICEKPVVLNPWNVEGLLKMETQTGKKVYSIQQLRLHPAIIALKEMVSKNPAKKYKVDLHYITARGNWYQYSWKGSQEKAGGIVSNIGIHFFDMLLWVFGKTKNIEVFNHTDKSSSGKIELENAEVSWMISIDGNDLPEKIKNAKRRTHRSLKIDEEEIDFSNGFEDLHTASYREIMEGGGCALKESVEVIDLIYKIRNNSL